MIDRRHVYAIYAVQFDAPSSLRRIDDSAFSECDLLRSIRIPASVEVIGKRCFSPAGFLPFPLRSVCFEPGSHLRAIEDEAFHGCTNLHSICLPASVSDISGSAFAKSGLRTIRIETGNMHFRVLDHYLLNFDATRIVFCPLKTKNAQIPDSVDTIGLRAFDSAHSLVSLSFGRRSSLRFIEAGAFWNCFRLLSICLPSSVREIGDRAFSGCCGLSEVTFEGLSQLTRIGAGTFSTCVCLKSFSVPSSVEFIGTYCFSGFLLDLTFESPSHLRELLSFVTRDAYSVDIPDSVEVLETVLEGFFHALIINFGQGSHLRSVRLSRFLSQFRAAAFVRVASQRLKVIRCGLEFM
jgi:hypothetical protein